MANNNTFQRSENKANVSRRDFLRGTGIGLSAAVVALSGLPERLGGGVRRAYAAVANGPRGNALQSSPEVELLVGDILGFSLDSNEWEGDFGWVKFRLHEAFYDGELAYYIRTDASDEAFAIENKLVWVPLLNAALSREDATSPVYIFANGMDDQSPILSTVPEQDDYNPAWRVHTVTFSGDASLLTSEADVVAAVDAGTVTVEPQNLVVNYPVVKWPGGELQEDPDKIEALGGGPLVAPVNPGHMEVTFKLHQCYPGSRYIVTDTSAVPMAPMMGIVGSGPTGILAEVGAVDNIWVFGNGLPGPGAMGGQPAVFRFEPGTAAWSPFWNHFTITWVDPDNARVLHDAAEVQAALGAGEIEVWNGTPNTHPGGFVVNCPVPIKARNTYEDHNDMMM